MEALLRLSTYISTSTEDPPSKSSAPLAFFCCCCCCCCSMMLSSSSDAPPGAPLRIRQDDKFYCRLLSRESSSAAGSATPSFRVYYGVASGAVPFVWESQPGTPKHPCSSAAAAAAASDDRPPLTPPPSYQSGPLRTASPRKASHGPNLLRAIVPRLARRKHSGGGVVPPSPQASPSSSPASYFSPVGSPHCQDPRRQLSSARSPFSSMAAGGEGPAPRFTVRHGSHLGCGKMVKKALLSIVGHGSSRIV
ncbi:hypothetical protein Taro_008416 [Colocasia esculenta]|uniref:Uncharacterized protein n=1 Tax=Colocasia esculenta TaxID=4460 RepID=A0A843TY78_COLES|nr:hypothetical protein [Colocasia esculenta]